jgi:hypothetical protein
MDVHRGDKARISCIKGAAAGAGQPAVCSRAGILRKGGAAQAAANGSGACRSGDAGCWWSCGWAATTAAAASGGSGGVSSSGVQ